LGHTETSLSQADAATANAVFKQMMAQGQSVFAASGDSGADSDGSTLSLIWPASDPFVVAVGGRPCLIPPRAYDHESTWDGGAVG